MEYHEYDETLSCGCVVKIGYQYDALCGMGRMGPGTSTVTKQCDACKFGTDQTKEVVQPIRT
jgi:hypothetical protein